MQTAEINYHYLMTFCGTQFKCASIVESPVYSGILATKGTLVDSGVLTRRGLIQEELNYNEIVYTLLISTTV